MRTACVLLVFVLAGCGSEFSVHGALGAGGSTFPPSLAALLPDRAPVNSLPFTMTVNGTNFTSDATAFWNGTPQHTVFVNSNGLLVAVTQTDLMFAGLAQAYVRTAGTNSNAVNFNVTV